MYILRRACRYTSYIHIRLPQGSFLDLTHNMHVFAVLVKNHTDYTDAQRHMCASHQLL